MILQNRRIVQRAAEPPPLCGCHKASAATPDAEISKRISELISVFDAPVTMPAASRWAPSVAEVIGDDPERGIGHIALFSISAAMLEHSDGEDVTSAAIAHINATRSNHYRRLDQVRRSLIFGTCQEGAPCSNLN